MDPPTQVPCVYPAVESYANGVFLYVKHMILFTKLPILLHGMVEYQTSCRRDVGIPPYNVFVYGKTMLIIIELRSKNYQVGVW